MPIRVEDFDRGRINLADYVAQVLRAMPHLAFTESELREEVSASMGGLEFNPEDFRRVLALMQAAGTIVSKEIDGQAFLALSPSERASRQ